MNRYACRCCGIDLVDDKAKKALEALEVIMDCNLTVNSAYRCPKHNRAVGGSKSSRHMAYRDAFDIAWPNDETRKKLLEAAVKLGFLGIGLGKTFIHIDMRRIHTIWIYK